MARYYLAVLTFNAVFSVLFYIKMKQSGLTLRSFVLISGFSLLSGMLFPLLTGFFNLYVALGINIIFVSLGAYFIAGMEGVSDKDLEEQPFEAVSYLTQRYENEEADLSEAYSTDEEVKEEIPLTEESIYDEIEEEPSGNEMVEKNLSFEEIDEKDILDDWMVEEKPIEDEILEDELIKDETLEDELIEDELIEDELIEDKLTEDEIVAEVPTDDEIVKDEQEQDKIVEDGPQLIDDEITIEDTIDYVVVKEEPVDVGIQDEDSVNGESKVNSSDEVIENIIVEDDVMELVAASAESEYEEYNQQGERVMNAAQTNTADDGELRESYINRGFEAKFEGKLDKAVQCFVTALEMSPPPDLELMLSLDLFSMLRELGHYDRAKECLTKFADRNYYGLSTAEVAEIKTSLKHLEILNDLLMKANTPGLSYSRVPALIKLSAEEKLNRWKNEIF